MNPNDLTKIEEATQAFNQELQEAKARVSTLKKRLNSRADEVNLEKVRKDLSNDGL